MIFFRRLSTLIIAFTLIAFISKAQDKPIGYWRSFFPYNTSVGLATNGNDVFNACSLGFYTFPATSGQASPVPYSKVEGMSDIGMECVAYDMATSTTVLVYTDGNIDLFKEKENTFYNVPDLMVKSIAASKTVYQVYTENGIAYLSSAIGVLVIDLTTHNVDETYYFYSNGNHAIPVTCFTRNGSYYYAATAAGVYRSAETNISEFQNPSVWQRIDSTDTLVNMASVDGVLFLSNSKSVYAFKNDSLQLVYSCPVVNDTLKGYTIIEHIDAGFNELFISEFRQNNFNGDIKMMDTGFHFVDSVYGNIDSNTHDSDVGQPLQVVQLLDSTIWFADGYYGLATRLKSGYVGVTPIPPGPSGPYSFDIYAYNQDLWVAHGGYDELFYPAGAHSRDGVSHYYNGDYTYYRPYSNIPNATLVNGYNPFDTLTDFVSVLKDQTTGTVYMGSYVDGLSIIYGDGSYQLLRQNPPSIFEPSGSVFGNNQRQILGLALDQQDNLWVSLFGAKDPLYVKSAQDSTWYKFSVPNTGNGGQMIIDDNGQVWYICSSVGNSEGVVVYNTNGTLSDPTDDTYYHLVQGAGSGNLPSNTVYSLAKDKNNNIWIGTDNGIGIASNCSAPFSNTPPCDVEIPIVQYDQFAGYLFAGSTVHTIAVDGANRKWVGTDNGVWLLSPDASQIVYRFTAENSPLPSDEIRKISIDPVTGDVYIGTDMGLMCYRSTATDGGTSNQNVLIFPDPVPSGYTGTIGIKGLVANADVRITDIDGQLVYRTTALGGQAVWNGMDYTGHRPQTGVYLIFVASSDGTQTYTGKIVFMH